MVAGVPKCGGMSTAGRDWPTRVHRWEVTALELKWGLVGLGALAGRVAPAIAASRNGRLIACASRSYDRAREFARDHRVEKVYADYEELVRDPEVDAVYVATPNHLHRPVVLAAAGAGKHVLCEKPMAPTVGEAEEMIAACRSAGVLLKVGFHLRFLPPVQAAVAAVTAGLVGAPRELTVQRYSEQPVSALAPWRRDLSLSSAGVLADVGVHLLDLSLIIVRERVERVFAVAYPHRSTGQPDETTTVLLELSGGCQAIIRCSRGLPVAANDLQLFGTAGMLCTGPLRWTDEYRLTIRTAEGIEDQRFPVEDLYRPEIEAFADEVVGIPTVIATGEDGLLLVRITGAAIRSLESGKAETLG